MVIAGWPGGGGSCVLCIFDNKPPPQSGPCLPLKKVGLIYGRIWSICTGRRQIYE